MKIHILFILLFICTYTTCANNKIDNALSQLDELISTKEILVEQKNQDIKKISIKYNLSDGSSTEAYNYFFEMSRAYRSFQFDSAYNYSIKLIDISTKIGDANLIAQSKTEFADILISSGLFHEAIDTLNTIDLNLVSNKQKGAYYEILSRAYFDLESFSQSDFYDKKYRDFGTSHLDSSLKYLPHNEIDYFIMKIQKHLKRGQKFMVIQIADSLINTNKLHSDELGVLYLNKAWAQELNGNAEESLYSLIMAATNDFQAVKKEAVALLYVANALFENGNVVRANKYINVAVDDSHFYGSSFRLWQISQYLPVIKAKHIITIEKQKKKLLYFVIIISILAITVLGAIFIIFKQLSVVRETKTALEKTNKQLAKTNEELAVTNRIKEEYIGYFFSVNSVLLEKLDKFKGSINRKFKRKQFDEIAIELNSLSIPMEKEIMLENFDKVFLKIYPDFVTKFNNLMKEGEEIRLKEGELLNTELRIFALVRLGIHNPEKIAKILDYSLNTIYAYKNRIKTRSVVPNNEFENEIMKIKHF